MGQQQLAQDVIDHLQAQSQRIETVSDSIQKFEEKVADDSKLLHDLLVSVENLGDTVRQMKTDYMNWDPEEFPVEQKKRNCRKNWMQN